MDEELSEVVEKGLLSATNDFSFVEQVDCVSICVPTPLDQYFQPDTYVEKSTRDIAKYLHKGMLIVLESTTYPGTTEEIIKPILESTGLKCEKILFSIFCLKGWTQEIKSINKEYT